MLQRRFLTVAVALPLFIGSVLAGGLWWIAFLSICVAVGTWESAQFLNKNDGKSDPKLFVPAMVVTWIIIVATYYATVSNGFHEGTSHPSPALVAILFLFAVLFMHHRVKQPSVSRLSDIVAAVAYPGLFFAMFVLLHHIGIGYFLFAAVVTWMTDTGAFFIGHKIGRTPLWKAVSPNKTVEGAVGGLIFGVLSGMLFAYTFDEKIAVFGGIALVASIMAQLGDLFESSLKRLSGVKDSGSLLPGHGGLLDRFDSLFFSVGCVYLIVSAL